MCLARGCRAGRDRRQESQDPGSSSSVTPCGRQRSLKGVPGPRGSRGVSRLFPSPCDVVTQVFGHPVSETWGRLSGFCCIWEMTFFPEGPWWGRKPPTLPGQRPVPTEGSQECGQSAPMVSLLLSRSSRTWWQWDFAGYWACSPGDGRPAALCTFPRKPGLSSHGGCGVFITCTRGAAVSSSWSFFSRRVCAACVSLRNLSLPWVTGIFLYFSEKFDFSHVVHHHHHHYHFQEFCLLGHFPFYETFDFFLCRDFLSASN